MPPMDFPCCYAMRIALLSGYVSVVNTTQGASLSDRAIMYQASVFLISGNKEGRIRGSDK